MNRKVKLTVKEQIEHMKSKGIMFNIVKEEEAEIILITILIILK